MKTVGVHPSLSSQLDGIGEGDLRGGDLACRRQSRWGFEGLSRGTSGFVKCNLSQRRLADVKKKIFPKFK